MSTSSRWATAAKWSFDPFGGEISGRRLYGRGALDMKSGACRRRRGRARDRARGVALDGRLELHAVVDGEAGGSGARDLVERGHRAAGLIVMEPTWQALMPAEGGLEWVRVTFRGRNAHSAWRYNKIFRSADSAGAAGAGCERAGTSRCALSPPCSTWSATGPPASAAHPLLPPGVNTIHPGVMVCGVRHRPRRSPAIADQPGDHPRRRGDRLRPEIPAQRNLRPNPAGFRGVRAAVARPGFVAARASAAGAMGFVRPALPPVNTPIDHAVPRAIIDSRAARGQRAPNQGLHRRLRRGALRRRRHPGHHLTAQAAARFMARTSMSIWISLKAVTRTLAAAVLRWCGVR